MCVVEALLDKILLQTCMERLTAVRVTFATVLSSATAFMFAAILFGSEQLSSQKDTRPFALTS